MGSRVCVAAATILGMPLFEGAGPANEASRSIDLASLEGLVRVLRTPAPDVASNLSHFLARHVAHSALVLLAEDELSQPRNAHGDPVIASGVTRQVLEAIRASVAPEVPTRLEIEVAGRRRAVLATVAGTGALLVLVDPTTDHFDQLILPVWQLVALRIQQFAHNASPAYLMESRAVSSVRVEAVAELADQHWTTLESLLSVLRSQTLDDQSARRVAANLATEAAVELRTATDRVRTASEEPVTQAFKRLQSDLLPLLRYRDVNVQFVEPPVDGRALPSEVAHGARAVVRGAILAFVDQPNVTRIRVQWDCDGRNLLIDLRDDGTSGLAADSEQVQPLNQRVLALRGTMSISTTEGWGSEMSVVLPLDPPGIHSDQFMPWGLAPREMEVLMHIAAGRRNRAIAELLGISENTVKFHASRIFRKLGVTSRSQVAAMVTQRRASVTGLDGMP
jgi:DNA-binding CsgD family transcriptional regulator